MGAPSRAAIATSDVDEAQEMLRQGGVPSVIRPAREDRDRFSLAVDAEGDAELILARYDLTGSWSLRAEPDLFAVAVATGDDVRWSKGEDRGTLGGLPVHFPPGRDTVHVDGSTEVFEVQFTAHALHRLGAEVHGVEHVRLGEGSRTPRSTAHAQYWDEVLRYTRRLADGSVLQNDHLFAALKANLAVTVLDAFALVESTRGWRLPPGTALAAFRRAVAFIESAAIGPITQLDVARAAGLPVRVLDQHFRTQTGIGVTEYLRTSRVIAAHTQLVRGEDSRETALRVVRRWGFTSLQTYLPLHRRIYPGRPLPFERTGGRPAG